MSKERKPLRGFDKIRERISQGFRSLPGPDRIWSVLFHALLWVLVVVYLESLLHGVVFHSLTVRYFYILGFSVPVALVVSLLLGLLPRRVNEGVSIGLVAVLCLIFGSQLVYYFVFGNLYSVSMVGLGGDAITSFWREMLLTMAEHAGVLLLCLLPIPLVCLACRIVPEIFQRADWRSRSRAVLAASAVAMQVVMVLSLSISGTGFYSPYSFYHGSDTTMKQATDTFGLLTAFRLELTHSDAGGEAPGYYTGLDLAALPKPDTAGDREEPTEYGWNVLDIDFDALNGMTEDKTLLALNSYISSLSGSRKNQYTGMLSDYNLILLCAESFSSAAIDPEVTPTLYKLAHEGFVFNHYYNSFPNNTTDGEYALSMGLMPDGSRGKTASSFYASRNSYLPMALGNIFMEQKGVQGYAYHNYLGSFYGRNQTHPNMGYQCKFARAGMTFTTSWPASDLEMMEQSVPDYLDRGQFLAYYMTFSGHYKYDRSTNPMAVRNYDRVRGLPYSETAKNYLACNIELDKALAYLLEQLEEAGVADRTAIVMAGDHFPYGLTDAQYNELMGYECDYFEKYHDTLIFWVGGMEEPVEVDAYCSTIDVLPTILNLWGFEYDSRLLAGTDALSDAPHTAVLVDQSFLTDKVWFDANTNTATWLADEAELPQGYLEGMIRLVKNKFSFSTDILNSAYYNFIFDEGAVTVSKYGWISQQGWDDFFGLSGDNEEGSPGEVTDQSEPQEGTTPEEGTEPLPEGQPADAGPDPDLPPEGQTPEQEPGTEGQPPREPGTDPVPEGEPPEQEEAPWIPTMAQNPESGSLPEEQPPEQVTEPEVTPEEQVPEQEPAAEGDAAQA